MLELAASFNNILMSTNLNIRYKFADSKESHNTWENPSFLEKFVHRFSSLFNVPHIKLLT